MWPHEYFLLLTPVERLHAYVDSRDILLLVHEFCMSNLLVISPVTYPKRLLLFCNNILLLRDLLFIWFRMLIVSVLSELFFLFLGKLLHRLMDMPWMSMWHKEVMHRFGIHYHFL